MNGITVSCSSVLANSLCDFLPPRHPAKELPIGGCHPRYNFYGLDFELKRAAASTTMFRMFCCKKKKHNRIQLDYMTDSLEVCLSCEETLAAFKRFLDRNHFYEECKTLTFILKCRSVLTEIYRLSPRTRYDGLPKEIQLEINTVYEMANDLNFDLTQMNSLMVLRSGDTEKKISALEEAKTWAEDLVRDVYMLFRKQSLENV